MVKNYIHLPNTVIERIKSDPDYRRWTSLAASDEFYGMKLDIINSGSGIDANTLHSSLCVEEDFPANAKFAFLHYTVSTGDLLTAYEMIFLGSSIDVPDFEGYTPLHIALHVILNNSRGTSPHPKLRATCRCIIKIIRLLLKHHADVNLVLEGQCPLTHACRMQHWELIELFAKYGAIPAPQECCVPPASFLLKPDLIARFNAIFERYAANPFVREPRPCPCFSGLPVIKCHAKEDRPYSPNLICLCGSEKRFGACCSRRNIFVYEQWNEPHQRIQISWSNRIPPDPLEQEPTHPLHKTIERVEKVVKMTGDVMTVNQLRQIGCRHKIDSGLFENETLIVEAFEYVENLALKGNYSELRLDPAFLYALNKADFRPWPTGRRQSKGFCLNRQTVWNTLVDQYIETSGDSRGRLDIERGAKLGLSLGAFYRVCENNGCDIMEGGSVPTHKLCSGCKIAVYCSSTCQRAAWKIHKKICRKLGQREQALPVGIVSSIPSSGLNVWISRRKVLTSLRGRNMQRGLNSYMQG
ncbi:hypothetical protein F5146DRAFT_520116 [Armillaria mellea]|nr:hypothetical protein F5146DRAFT_520116 [Armillaria mellea]